MDKYVRESVMFNGQETQILLAHPFTNGMTRVVLIEPDSAVEWRQLYVPTELLERFCRRVAEELEDGHALWCTEDECDES